MKILNSPTLCLFVLAGFFWLAWYSQHRPTPEQQMSALVERSLAEAEAHHRAQAAAEEDMEPSDWDTLFNKCLADKNCAGHYRNNGRNRL
ncbi:MAG: hypothetical protein K8U57_27600 [Planctomycetes bacterium]|nr:hypothetical protein [Planctomycetota bacterium]